MLAFLRVLQEFTEEQAEAYLSQLQGYMKRKDGTLRQNKKAVRDVRAAVTRETAVIRETKARAMVAEVIVDYANELRANLRERFTHFDRQVMLASA